MRFRNSVLHISVLAFSAAFVPFAAQAGFEWVAPKEDMSETIQLPIPKPGLPRISPQPLDGGLDPLPPLSIDQENGTRATVYGAAPRPAPAMAAPLPESAMAPAAQPAPRMKTLNRGSGPESRLAGRAAMPAIPFIDNPDQPRQLRMADELVVPSDADIAPPTAPASPVTINPAPLASPAFAAPAASAPMAAAAVEEAAPSGPVLEGFGSEIPLVMALQQIVPPDYTYSFGGGVNPGESVSWEGGKSWAQVLSEMLEGEGLRASIRGRSIQIQGGTSSSPRAQIPAAVNVASSDAVAEKLSETAPAAGEEESAAAVVDAALAAVAPAPAPELKPAATSVAKVEAVPPVYPPEVFAKNTAHPVNSMPVQVQAAVPPPMSAKASAPAPARVLGSISEKNGLRIEELKETVQVQGSPAAAKAARQAVADRAVGLAPPADVNAAADVPADLPRIETTSYSVTKTTRKPAPESLIPAELTAAPAAPAIKREAIETSITAQIESPRIKAAPVSAEAVKPAPAKSAPAVEGDIQKALSGRVSGAALQASRRSNITDPGETPSRQPEVQALNMKQAEAPAQNPPAAKTADAAPRPLETAAADIPAGPPVPRNSGREDQLKKLQDMARQQGVVLDAKNYNIDTLGKVFNNGIAPAAGDDISPVAPGDIQAWQPRMQKTPPPAVARQDRVKVALPESLPARTIDVQKDMPLENPPAAPASKMTGKQRLWEVRKGEDLKKTLGKWSRESGVVLMWKAKRPYQTSSDIMVHGGYNDAIRTLAESGNMPVMRLADNGKSGRTLTVED